MAEGTDQNCLPAGFSGRVRLFPLPNLVLFPHAAQPLHIFEPRYLSLVDEALSTDRLITMALLQAGWKKDYESAPPIDETVCIGRILTYARQHDGRLNLFLAGVQRARVVRELNADSLYRQAEVQLLEDFYPKSGSSIRSNMKRRLLQTSRNFLAAHSGAISQFDKVADSDIQLGALTDILAFSLNLGLLHKQELLAEVNVDRRAEMLLTLVSETLSTSDVRVAGYPPDFSLN